MHFQPKELRFEEILPTWAIFLWPGRATEIKPVSPIDRNLTFCADILNSKPKFWGIFSSGDEPCGVISGYSSGGGTYRSRGLFIYPTFRKMNLSGQLFSLVARQAAQENHHTVWSLPRQAAWPSYEKFGFVKKSDWFDKGMEFGPNCIAELPLIKGALLS